MKKFPIADLHCDLLVYLDGAAGRTPYDSCCRCSIGQLQSGNVVLQVLPAYVSTEPHSSIRGMSQAKIFENLPPISGLKTLFAFENASGFCAEGESLEKGFDRLSSIKKIVYISMTWNDENRFGGGAHTDVGLKNDGELLLEFLHQKKIAIDFSHTSDRLAEDILNYTLKKSLNIPVMASHSNFREVTGAPRNLPKHIAKEIIDRKGVIGLNFVKPFVGTTDHFVRHLEYGLNLRAEDQLCLGADFFYVDDPTKDYFFEDFSDASCYPKVIDLWKTLLSDQMIEKITKNNLVNYLEQQIYE